MSVCEGFYLFYDENRSLLVLIDNSVITERRKTSNFGDHYILVVDVMSYYLRNGIISVVYPVLASRIP